MSPDAVRAGRSIALLALLLAAAAGASRAEAPRPASLADCDARVASAPGALGSYRCYWFVARNTAAWDGATRRLEDALRRDPSNVHARLILGAIAADRGDARAEPLLRAAADGYARAGAAQEEVYARVTLGVFQRRRGNREAAADELDRALARATSSGEERLVAEVRIQLGWQKYYERDYGAAWTQLERAEAVVFPSGSIFHRLDTVDGLAAVAWALGRHDEALAYYERQLDLLQGTDRYRAAFVRRNALLVLRELVDAGERDPASLVASAREALDAARAAGNRLSETGARLILAERIPAAEALEQARAALEVARATAHTGDHVWALRVIAERMLEAEPARVAEALGLLDEAVALARAHGDVEDGVAAQAGRARVTWRNGDRGRALAETVSALDAIERVRDLQPDREVRARVFARFADTYRDAVDRILVSSGTPPAAPDVAAAFTVAERMRARALLDTLDAAGVSETLAPSSPQAKARESVLGEIAAVQRQLVSTSLPRHERENLLVELDRLEAREVELRDAIARADPRFAALRRPALVGLDALRAALEPDQALLAFVLPHGGRTSRGWVFVVSRPAATAVPVEDAASVEREALLYLSLIACRDGSERAGAPRLFRRLLGPALAALPPGIRRLVLVPDGVVHGLPLDTLRSAPGAPFVAETFVISLAPSATTWLRWRSAPPARGAVPLLAFADPAPIAADGTPPIAADGTPAIAADGTPAIERIAGTVAEGLRAGALPHARREARRLARAFGGDSVVLTGADASERALKTADLDRYVLLHFAAHGLLDDARPERSAVLLASGAGGDDGLLQYREIVGLPLHGQTVVLSSCRSATGPVLGGEGAMGLASAFLHAGAGSVVASLWPLRDAETADFVDAVGQRLARGASVGQALADARRGAIAEGAPPAAWAAFALYGHGDLVPWPAAGRTRPGWLVPALAAAVLAAVVVAGRTLYRRRTAP